MDSHSFLNQLIGGMAGMHSTHSNQSAGSYTQRDYTPKQAESPTSDVALLEDRVERLTLVCMAMWSLLQDKTNLTEQDLSERVEVIDMMDGNPDGKASRTVKKCHSCGRPMSMRHRRCLYCGADKLHTSAFDAV